MTHGTGHAFPTPDGHTADSPLGRCVRERPATAAELARGVPCTVTLHGPRGREVEHAGVLLERSAGAGLCVVVADGDVRRVASGRVRR